MKCINLLEKKPSHTGTFEWWSEFEIGRVFVENISLYLGHPSSHTEKTVCHEGIYDETQYSIGFLSILYTGFST